MTPAVIDTNVLVSALVYGGLPLQILTLAASGRVRLCTSPVLLDELRRVLREKIQLGEADIAVVLARITDVAHIVHPTELLKVVDADPDDDRLFECAVAAGASFLVTGDGKVLKVGRYRQVAVVTPRQFLEHFA